MVEPRTFLFQENAVLSSELRKVNLIVLEDARFWAWPGSASKHHAHDGGLALHTAEVVSLVKGTIEAGAMNWAIAFTAGLWHDYGKIWDYRRSAVEPSGWTHTSHRDMVRHLVRSYAEFMRHATGVLDSMLIERVSHCILAHHGRMEWGSPVMPQTPEAWALHLADMASVKCVNQGAT